MFSFLFSGDTPEQQPPSDSSLNPSTKNYNSEAADTRIEHRTDDEIDEKVHLADSKPSLTDLSSHVGHVFETTQNSDLRNHAVNPAEYVMSHSDVYRPTEDKHNKVELQNTNKPVEVKPNSEVFIKPQFDTKQQPAIKHQTDGESHPEVEHNVDKNSHLKTEQHISAKPHPDIKPQTEANSSYSKQQSEVKTGFEVKENAQSTPQFDLKHQGDIKTYQQGFGNHHTEVESHFDVKEHPEIKPIKPQLVVNTYPEFKHPAGLQTHFDVNERVEDKPYFNYEPLTELKPRPDVKQNLDTQLPAIKPNVPAVKPPSKTKVETKFNLVTSMLKISGCNIYGRMYRVGKIISELSNPCLECMCTEIGVYCNQLKC